MDMLSININDMKTGIPMDITLPDVLKLGISLVQAIRKLHEADLVHGDI